MLKGTFENRSLGRSISVLLTERERSRFYPSVRFPNTPQVQTGIKSADLSASSTTTKKISRQQPYLALTGGRSWCVAGKSWRENLGGKILAGDSNPLGGL